MLVVGSLPLLARLLVLARSLRLELPICPFSPLLSRELGSVLRVRRLGALPLGVLRLGLPLSGLLRRLPALLRLGARLIGLLGPRLLGSVLGWRVSLLTGRLSGRLGLRTLLGLPGLSGLAVGLGLWLRLLGLALSTGLALLAGLVGLV